MEITPSDHSDLRVVPPPPVNNGLDVVAIGGFNGSDPYPTLAQFKKYARTGMIHFSIAGSIGGNQQGGSDTASQIATWVEKNFTATTVDGVTIYNLTSKA